MADEPYNIEIERGCDWGPKVILCKDGRGNVVPLAGWTAYAVARKDAASPVVLDFAPVISADDAEGKITFPAISHSATAALPEGVYGWDLVLQHPDGYRLPSLLSGVVSIFTPTSQWS